MARVKPGSPAKKIRRASALERLKEHLEKEPVGQSKEEHKKSHQKELDSLQIK